LQLATVVAATAGKVIAFLMIGSGILMILGIRIPFFGTGVFNGIWLALIGWFLFSGAQRQSRRQLRSSSYQESGS
jgi:small neutral amino acid transporter SnatA (MarC family)